MDEITPPTEKWSGVSWSIIATPGEEFKLKAEGGVIEIDDQDVEMLCETVLDSADDDALRSFESCADFDCPSIFVWGEGDFVKIDAQYTFINLSILKSEAYEFAVALLAARDHWSLGPCKYCGISMGDHPCNGC